MSAWSSPAATPVSTTVAARSIVSSWAARSTTRRARLLTRSPACSAWAIRAARRSSAWHGAGNPRAFAFPRSFLHDDRPVFSFSGLKTAVLYALRGPNEERGVVEPSPAMVADLAASFQEAVVDVLVAKTRQALEQTGLKRLGVGGGVAANTRLRERIASMARNAASSCSFRPCPSAPTTPPWPASPWPSWPRARSPRSTSTSPPGWSGRGEAKSGLKSSGLQPHHAFES